MKSPGLRRRHSGSGMAGTSHHHRPRQSRHGTCPPGQGRSAGVALHLDQEGRTRVHGVWVDGDGMADEAVHDVSVARAQVKCSHPKVRTVDVGCGRRRTLNWLLILSILGAIGTVFTVIQMMREMWSESDGVRSKRLRAVLYPLIVIVLTAMSVYLATLNQELTEIKSQARALRGQWTSYSGLQYEDNGYSLGIVQGGLSFVEQYKTRIPVTVDQARELAIEARKVCLDPNQYRACDATAGGMMGLIDAIAGPKPED